jgi:hypothetical protein
LREFRRGQPKSALAWIAKFIPIRLLADRERDPEGFGAPASA